MRVFLIAVLLSALAVPGALAQISGELPLAAPEAVGMSTERLARIDGVLRGFVERGEVPGFVTLVARKGRIVHWEAHGATRNGV